MEVSKITEITFPEQSAITVGMFDGVHLAHQSILNRVVTESKRINGRSVVVTFDPHPREIISAEKNNLSLLTTLDERKCLYNELEIDLLVVIEFDKYFSQLNYRDFCIEYLINKIGAKVVVEGYDYHWGRNREGNIESLEKLGKEYNFEVIKIDKYVYNDIPVSSSVIRSYLQNGNVEKATELLGRPYSIQGKVIEGNRRGRTLGYPTANIDLSFSKKLIPMNGIYFSKAILNKNKYFGMTSIGTRPTFEQSKDITIEVNILDFNKEIYGEEIKIEFLKRLRDEIRFDSKEKLIEQMNIDRNISKTLQYKYEE